MVYDYSVMYINNKYIELKRKKRKNLIVAIQGHLPMGRAAPSNQIYICVFLPIALMTADTSLSLSPSQPYDKWLPAWTKHMVGVKPHPPAIRSHFRNYTTCRQQLASTTYRAP